MIFRPSFSPLEVRLARSPTSAALTPSSSSFRHASSGQEKDTAAKLSAVKRGKRSVAHPLGAGKGFVKQSIFWRRKILCSRSYAGKLCTANPRILGCKKRRRERCLEYCLVRSHRDGNGFLLSDRESAQFFFVSNSCKREAWKTSIPASYCCRAQTYASVLLLASRFAKKASRCRPPFICLLFIP